MKNKSTIIILCILFLLSCGNKNNYLFCDNNTLIENVDNSKHLYADIFAENCFSIERLILSNNYVIQKNYSSSYCFDAYDKNSKNHLLSFGSNGRAMNEFSSPYFNKQTTDNGLWIKDVGNFTLKHIDIIKTLQERVCVIDEIIPTQKKLELSTYFTLNDSLLMFYTNVQDWHSTELDRFLLELYRKKPFELLKTIDLYGKIDRTKEINQHGTIAMSPDKKNVVIAMNYVNQLNILNLETDERKSVSLYTKPDIEQNFNQNGPTVLYYLDVCLSNENIYCLYVNQNFSNYQKQNQPVEIHKFDIKGNFIQVFTIDEHLSGIDIDESANKLYGFSDVKEIIYRYDLSK